LLESFPIWVSSGAFRKSEIWRVKEWLLLDKKKEGIYIFSAFSKTFSA
jgi:hypothetical protein